MKAVAKGEIEQSVKVNSLDELAGMAASFNQMTQSLRKRHLGREYLRCYLSPEVCERILKEENALEMTPEERNMTVLCLTFHGLTTIGGQHKSLDAFKIFNEYLAPVIDAITDARGVVNLLEGNRLLAVWGVPFPVKEAEYNAILGARAILKAVQSEARRQVTAGGSILEASMGIAAGRAVAGNLGSSKRVEYAVVGNAVELAGHIEKQARPGEILINEAAFSKVRGEVQAAACSPLILEGMEEAVPLYRLAH
jgi:adenylate cyclase